MGSRERVLSVGSNGIQINQVFNSVRIRALLGFPRTLEDDFGLQQLAIGTKSISPRPNTCPGRQGTRNYITANVCPKLLRFQTM